MGFSYTILPLVFILKAGWPKNKNKSIEWGDSFSYGETVINTIKDQSNINHTSSNSATYSDYLDY
jgi:hypothetical protein